jgi:hypothetical protein
MKKLFLSIALVAITTIGAMAQVSFGIQVGPNFAMGKYSQDNGGYPIVFTNDPKVGVFGGFLAEIPFGEKIAFRPELNFIQKGSKSGFSLAGFGSPESKITLNYLELPLNVVYKLQAGSGNFFFGLGPALAFGLSGKEKRTDPNDPTDPDTNGTFDVKFDGKKSDDINNGNGDNYFHAKRVDVGLNILAGYKLPMGVFFRVAYTHGFMNIDADKDNAAPADQSSYKNRGVSIGIGYMFGSK